MEKILNTGERDSIAKAFREEKQAPALGVLDLGTEGSGYLFPFEYERRKYYSVTFLEGNYTLELEDTHVPLNGQTLLFTTTKIPFGIKLIGKPKAGLSFIFQESFITKMNSGYRLLEFPVYKPGNQNVYSLTGIEAQLFTGIFDKMLDVQNSGNPYKENLQRTYLLEMIFQAQALKPVGTYQHQNNTAEEIACSFIRLLESQFPVETPASVLKLKTAQEFADALALHPNYLNRQVKIAKNRTISDIIAARILQESKILLKITNWNIAEISFSLGFEEPSHFNSFFKKHSGVSPTTYRKIKV